MKIIGVHIGSAYSTKKEDLNNQRGVLMNKELITILRQEAKRMRGEIFEEEEDIKQLLDKANEFFKSKRFEECI